MMISPNIKNICEQTQLYYYDFLFQNGENDIPEKILCHIRQCGYCQKQIYKLKTALAGSEQNNSSMNEKNGTPIVNTLQRHFSYINKDILCANVKPFLPDMIDSSTQITIPTPITAHIDHCPECVNDLKTISNFNLNHHNLSRLSRLLAAKPDKNVSCERARSDIMAFVMIAFQESDEQTLEHLCTCDICNAIIFQYRESIYNELLIENKSNPCFLSTKISYNNLLEYVTPYGLNISNFQNPESISRISHIRRCPFCLKKIQELHHSIMEIKERPNSNTVTKYNIAEPQQTLSSVNSNDLYADFPVNVEVTGAYEKTQALASESTINYTAARKRKILAKSFRTLSKTGFAGLIIAAIMLTAIFLYSPKAKATNLAQIYASIENVNNVHIMSYMANQNKLIQEQWVSRTSNAKISKINDNLSFLDLKKESIVEKNINSQKTKTLTLTRDMQSDFERDMNSSLGLMPYYSVSNIPFGAEWKPESTESQEITGEGEIYDLLYTSDTSGDPEFIKYRFILQKGTDLPVRIEFYRKTSLESKYLMETYYTVEYLTNEEFNAVKNKYFE